MPVRLIRPAVGFRQTTPQALTGEMINRRAGREWRWPPALSLACASPAAGGLPR
jgi:hypothetical protein